MTSSNSKNASFSDLSHEKAPIAQQYQLKSHWYCFYSIRYWQYFGLMVLGNYGSTLLSYSYKPFGESSSDHTAINDGLLTWAASIGAGLLNGIARLCFGNLADKFSFRLLMGIILTLELVTCLMFYWAANCPALYFTAIMFNYICIAGIYAIFPVSVTQVFGLKRGPQVYV